MTEDKKKYNAMEPILNNINRKYISLPDEDDRRNKIILKGLLDSITSSMKASDNLFKEMYSSVFYGGSYYDGLRVGQPDEFDLDLLLSLPKLVEPTLTTSNKPGFVHVKLNGYNKFIKQSEMISRYKGLEKLMNEKTHYLETNKVLRWMQRVITLTMNTFEKKDGRPVLKIPSGEFYLKYSQSGPAVTLKVEGVVGESKLKLDIDLVPCFVFGKDHWPSNGFRSNSTKKKPEFFIVPKPLNGLSDAERYWRLSFQEQERELIDGKSTLKPTIKLLKRMRDILDHKCIASYYIKTFLIWEVSEWRKEDFWNNSLSYVFMNVLKDYYEYLKKKKIPYYWNKNNNLIDSVREETLINIGNKVKAIIDDVDKNLEDPYVIAKYLLKPSELADFKSYMKIPTK
ncbi:unnamed protein product [Phaedon cochleariae]|uniref:Cyclic GMP-AMP synthase n=1 Tax=Phaedon cochleariae TaxID=80249 RepID=A0A9P0DMK6_PHACE|nr:unnamed protein product [Phaedon cochleariae]